MINLANHACRLIWRNSVETGLAAVASIAAYTENRIRKQELTTPAKEDDRVRQIEAVGAQTGPVMLAYPDAHWPARRRALRAVGG